MTNSSLTTLSSNIVLRVYKQTGPKLPSRRSRNQCSKKKRSDWPTPTIKFHPGNSMESVSRSSSRLAQLQLDHWHHQHVCPETVRDLFGPRYSHFGDIPHKIGQFIMSSTIPSLAVPPPPPPLCEFCYNPSHSTFGCPVLLRDIPTTLVTICAGTYKKDNQYWHRDPPRLGQWFATNRPFNNISR